LPARKCELENDVFPCIRKIYTRNLKETGRERKREKKRKGEGEGEEARSVVQTLDWFLVYVVQIIITVLS
jgi:ribosome assembly protein YihI (activator of Der GTPase)